MEMIAQPPFRQVDGELGDVDPNPPPLECFAAGGCRAAGITLL
jgi:hypothetical protein